MPDTEITRAQTRERARLLFIRSYDVDLDFTRGPDTFGSVSLIRFDCREPGAATHADLIAAGVREITLNGVPLDPASAWANGRITLPGLAARNELRVAAECAYSRSGTGVHREDSADGSVHIYAKLAQAYARTAYACFDQPDLKAVFTFQVTAPAHWTVLSNQPQDDAERTRGNSRTRRFLPTPRLPTFTTTVVAGDYHVVAARLAQLLFPYPAVTPEFLTQIDGFLAAGGTDPGLARIVRDHRDTAERALRARTLPSQHRA